MAVNINVPSQVKTYANLAAFPATGALKTIYIAEDTNKTYRWTGSVYTEISASAAMTWGAIGGTLSNQTDLQSALNAKQDNLGFTPVPTTRTLTINGTTQDLSADRTFTISTGITIGTTAITSGTVGRVLFQGTGNVVQQSSSLFWDNTNGRLGIGTDTPTTIVHINGNAAGTAPSLQIRQQANTTPTWFAVRNTDNLASAGAISLDLGISGGAGQFFTGTAQGDIVLKAYSNGSTSKFFVGATSGSSSNMVLFPSGNTGLNTTTDAGFRLDVNGTARVSGSVTLNSNILLNAASATNSIVHNSTFASSTFSVLEQLSGQNIGGFIINSGTGESRFGSFRSGGGYYTTFYVNNAELIRLSTSNNVLINTTTDAGFRLDVNGTARVQSGTTGTTPVLTVTNTSSGNFTFLVNNSGTGNANFGMQINGTTKASVGYSRSGDFLGFFVDGATTNYFLGQYNVDGSFQKNRTSDGIADFKVFNGGGTIVGAATLNASAQLQVDSTTKGFLPPRMTTTQKNAIASPAAGLMVYDTTLNVISYYNGSMWI